MPFRDPRQSLQDMLERIELIQTSTTGHTLEALRQNPEKLAAVERWLLIIAEAASRLGPEAERICPGPDWRNIRGFGNVLRHEYDGIDPYQLWNVVVRELAPLKRDVLLALATLRAEKHG